MNRMGWPCNLWRQNEATQYTSSIFNMLDFRKIDFGNTDAQTESQNNPHLLIEGYYDLENRAERMLNTTAFLVLGYKGSGKTALAEHLYLKSKDDNSFVVEKISLKDLAYIVL